MAIFFEHTFSDLCVTLCQACLAFGFILTMLLTVPIFVLLMPVMFPVCILWMMVCIGIDEEKAKRLSDNLEVKRISVGRIDR